ncbi:MAG: MFS transporter [Tardiphaga sp.]|nr:MFS transporter [Tardiphaga sp.]
MNIGIRLAARNPDTAPSVAYALMAALVILTCGHVLSNLLRTMPAMAIDLLAADLGSTAQRLAALTAAYHFSFAICQIPVGVALDRYSIRNVALTLLVGTFAGAGLAALWRGPASFLAAQLLLGLATSGMLMCPMALAAKRLSSSQFGVWSGLILSLGNAGMLLSASPLAFVVEQWGWRTGFWLAGFAALAVAGLVILIVPGDRPQQVKKSPALRAEMRTVLRLGAAPALRGIVILAFVSLAVLLVLRGLWVGPWLMDVKGLSRLDAGNVLTVFTVALVVGPALMGLVDRRIGQRRMLLLVTQLIAAALFVLLACGAPGMPLARAFAVVFMPVSFDIVVLVSIGLLVCVQPLIYAMTRQMVALENTGKALSAVNLAFFLGVAVMQSATAPIAASWGLPAVLIAMAVFLTIGVVSFFMLTRTPAARLRQ